MSRFGGGYFAARAQSLVAGFVRSVVLVVLTGLIPAVWVALAVFFSRVSSDPGLRTWCVLGSAVVSLVFLTRPVCGAVRTVVARWTGTELAAAYRPLVPVTRMATGYWWNGYNYQRRRWRALWQRRVHARVLDPASWREMLWILVSPLTVGVSASVPLALLVGGVVELAAPTSLTAPVSARFRVLAAVASIVVGVLLLPAGWRLVGPVARRLLGPALLTLLTARITTLIQGRADLTQTQEAELRRIERNLHDGAQARLVAIGLSIGAAERLVDTDPVEAKAVMRQTREASAAALRELRELVHGIVPPVLLERGLVDAIRALALDTSVPTVVHSALERRLEMPIESALYFSTAELVTNAVKHSHASAIGITIEPTALGVSVTVSDDGDGGARLSAGSGLAGIRSRLDAFDGTVDIDSPSGGPTHIAVEVPCASS